MGEHKRKEESFYFDMIWKMLRDQRLWAMSALNKFPILMTTHAPIVGNVWPFPAAFFSPSFCSVLSTFITHEDDDI